MIVGDDCGNSREQTHGGRDQRFGDARGDRRERRLVHIT
jgi:hypothetical protein